MAIVRIDYTLDLTVAQRRALAESVNATMQTVLGVPPRENYIVSSQHPNEAILHAPDDCPPERQTKLIFIQATLNQGRTPELKLTFLQALTTAIADCTPFAPTDVFINLVEVARENWSFGLPSA